MAIVTSFRTTLVSIYGTINDKVTLDLHIWMIGSSIRCWVLQGALKATFKTSLIAHRWDEVFMLEVFRLPGGGGGGQWRRDIDWSMWHLEVLGEENKYSENLYWEGLLATSMASISRYFFLVLCFLINEIVFMREIRQVPAAIPRRYVIRILRLLKSQISDM